MSEAALLYNMILIVQSQHPRGKGTFFSAINLTSNGEERVWNCRFGVTSHRRGGVLPYKPEDKDLIIVWDRKRKDYRSIKVTTLYSLKVCGQYLIKNGAKTSLYHKHYEAARVMDILKK